MKIQLWVVGKTTRDFVEHGLTEFCERIKHYLPFDIQVVPDIKNTKNLSAEQVREKEGEAILKLLRPDDFLVLLDEHGREYSSLQFAAYLERKMHVVPKSLIFIIGGPYGFSKKVREAAQDALSLSRMTFPHQLVRLIFAEQLYRALTILHSEPYHHE
jgi:23S rRNA (pseudouridine1915-N3)-methyltransferase